MFYRRSINDIEYSPTYLTHALSVQHYFNVKYPVLEVANHYTSTFCRRFRLNWLSPFRYSIVAVLVKCVSPLLFVAVLTWLGFPHRPNYLTSNWLTSMHPRNIEISRTDYNVCFVWLAASFCQTNKLWSFYCVLLITVDLLLNWMI